MVAVQVRDDLRRVLDDEGKVLAGAKVPAHPEADPVRPSKGRRHLRRRSNAVRPLPVGTSDPNECGDSQDESDPNRY